MRRRLIAALSVVLLLGAPAGAETRSLDHHVRDHYRAGPFQRDGMWAAMARRRQGLTELWERFNLPGSPPDFDFNEKVAVLTGMAASYKCPVAFHDVRLDPDRERVVARLYDDHDHEACADDYRPHTWFVTIRREALKPFSAGELRVIARRIERPGT